MKPSMRYQWLMLYSMAWTMFVLIALWLWGDAVLLPQARGWACVAIAAGTLLIAAFIWLRYGPDGKRRQKQPPPSAAPKPPVNRPA